MSPIEMEKLMRENHEMRKEINKLQVKLEGSLHGDNSSNYSLTSSGIAITK
jgi:hypothetical protein